MAFVLAATIFAAVAPASIEAGAQAPSLFYRTTAQANASFVEVRRPGYILEPILQLNPLDTQVALTSTGTRDSLASLLNPGPVGDFPALLGLAVAGLPPIPYPGYPLTVRASHPLTPDAVLGLGDIPGGGASDAASARPFTAEAKADEDSASATGTGAALTLAAGLIEIGGVVSRTEAVDNGGVVTVTATAGLANVDIADLIEIEAVETKSVATIDGARVTIDTVTTVGAIRALGAELALDEGGLRVVTLLGIPAPPPLLIDSVTETLTNLMAQLGLDVRLVDGETVEGPADGLTTVLGGGGGLEITLPVTIPADVPIPSLPIPLGIPVGGGIPTNVTVALARTAVSAVAGTPTGFDADLAGGAGLDSGGPPVGGVPTAPTGVSVSVGQLPVLGTGTAEPGSLPAAPTAPSIDGGVGLPVAPATVSRPDLTPAFRWTLLTAIAVILSGWPIARRRLAGVSGLSATALLQSISDPRRSR